MSAVDIYFVLANRNANVDVSVAEAVAEVVSDVVGKTSCKVVELSRDEGIDASYISIEQSGHAVGERGIDALIRDDV